MPHLLVIFTGGTISMKADPATGGALPALSGAEILALTPAPAEIEILDFARLAGPHITPDHMWRLHQLIEQHAQRPGLAGIVITHGTDTLEETAYFLDLQHRHDLPVIVTGAMRNASHPGFDGPANLHAALRVALDPQSRGRGVLVAFNHTIHAASAATKTDSQALETFQSPLFGPLGIIDHDRVLYYRRLESRQVLAAPGYEPKVDVILMHAGADSRFFHHSIDTGARGIVIEGTGAGNVTPFAVEGIQRALDAGLAVVLTTRCAQGRVVDAYAYPGSGQDLRRRGVLFGDMQNAAKTRIQLMLALAKARTKDELRPLIEQGRYDWPA